MTSDDNSEESHRPRSEERQGAGGPFVSLGVILLLGALGFMIYGAMLPNNPPDLIVGGLVSLVGIGGCLIFGCAFLIFGLLLGKR
jgi:hypothetical protein